MRETETCMTVREVGVTAEFYERGGREIGREWLIKRIKDRQKEKYERKWDRIKIV